jgi:hypothetical protein
MAWSTDHFLDQALAEKLLPGPIKVAALEGEPWVICRFPRLKMVGESPKGQQKGNATLPKSVDWSGFHQKTYEPGLRCKCEEAWLHFVMRRDER